MRANIPRSLRIGSFHSILCGLLLSLLLASPRTSHAARPWPDTRFRIVPFADQLPNSMTETQRWFAATKFAGTQKMLRSEIRQIRAYNTNFLCLHYQLAVGCGPAALRRNQLVCAFTYDQSDTHSSPWMKAGVPAPTASW